MTAIDDAAARTNPDPSPAQREAGNYAKGRFTWRGLEIAIETPAGEYRRGRAWKVRMPVHYGYFTKHPGADGDKLDVFFGEHPKSDLVIVIETAKKDGSFDEHKVMLAFPDRDAALAAFEQSYADGFGDRIRRSVLEFKVDQFKEWLAGGRGVKPLTKRTPGTPLSEAEVEQRRNAAKRRWEIAAAGGATAGAGAGLLGDFGGFKRRVTGAYRTQLKADRAWATRRAAIIDRAVNAREKVIGSATFGSVPVDGDKRPTSTKPNLFVRDKGAPGGLRAIIPDLFPTETAAVPAKFKRRYWKHPEAPAYLGPRANRRLYELAREKAVLSRLARELDSWDPSAVTLTPPGPNASQKIKSLWASYGANAQDKSPREINRRLQEISTEVTQILGTKPPVSHKRAAADVSEHLRQAHKRGKAKSITEAMGMQSGPSAKEVAEAAARARWIKQYTGLDTPGTKDDYRRAFAQIKGWADTGATANGVTWDQKRLEAAVLNITAKMQAAGKTTKQARPRTGVPVSGTVVRSHRRGPGRVRRPGDKLGGISEHLRMSLAEQVKAVRQTFASQIARRRAASRQMFTGRRWRPGVQRPLLGALAGLGLVGAGYGVSRLFGDRDRSLGKRDPGRPLSEAEREQRREAAEARWRGHVKGSSRPVSASLRGYIEGLQAYKPLTVTEEVELGRRIKAGDIKARDRLVEAHLRMVPAEALRMRGYNIPIEEMVQQGNVGLINAAANFDPDKGIRFSVLARAHIKAHLYDHAIKSRSMVRMGTTKAERKVFFNLARERATLGEIGDREMSEDAVQRIAHRLKVPPQTVRDMARRLHARDTSLTVQTDDGEEDPGGMDRLLGFSEATAERSLVGREDMLARRKAISTGMKSLDPRERRIIAERWLKSPPRDRAGVQRKQKAQFTHQEVGAKLGISAERVRQLEVRALAKLRAAMKEAGVEKLAKAAPRNWAEAVAAKYELDLARALADAFMAFRKRAEAFSSNGSLAKAVDPGNPEDALSELQSAVQKAVEPAAGGAFGDGSMHVRRTAGGGRDGWLAFSFDWRHPNVERHLRRYTFDLVREIVDSQRRLIAGIITRMGIGGLPPARMAQDIKDGVGLTSWQAGHVMNYRRELENLDGRALERNLRDKRFDRSVLNALRDGQPLGQGQIDKMVAAYQRRWIAYRSMTIARTESLRAANLGAVTTAEQLEGEGQADVIKTWMATQDNRTREAHRELDGQMVAGMSTPFVLKDGSTIRYPHDPLAPPALTINCRCTLNVRVVPRGAGQRYVAERVTPQP